jgi:sugar/nucleoside kinase (ribokinase family)
MTVLAKEKALDKYLHEPSQKSHCHPLRQTATLRFCRGRKPMGQRQLIALGSINVDIQVRAERWPAQGALISGRDFLMASGGKAANRAYVARQLGVDAQLIARTGDDMLARHALQPLAALGVDLRYTAPVADCATGVAMILVWPNAAKSILLAANANARWRAAEATAVEHAIAEARPGALRRRTWKCPRSSSPGRCTWPENEVCGC